MLGLKLNHVSKRDHWPLICFGHDKIHCPFFVVVDSITPWSDLALVCLSIHEVEVLHVIYFNTLALRRFRNNSRIVIFKPLLEIDIWSNFCEIVFKQMYQVLTDDLSTLVHAVVWCPQTPSHYLNQCWHTFISPYGFTRPQCIKNINISKRSIHIPMINADLFSPLDID